MIRIIQERRILLISFIILLRILSLNFGESLVVTKYGRRFFSRLKIEDDGTHQNHNNIRPVGLLSTENNPSQLLLSRSAFVYYGTVATTVLVTLGNPPESKAAEDDSRNKADVVETLTNANNSPPQQWRALEESISGFVAGAALTSTKTIVKYPLDTATVRLQMPGTAYSIQDLPQLFDGSFRGITLPLLSNVPAGAVFFAVKDAAKSSIADHLGWPKWVATSLAVAIAQLPYWLVRNPSEVVKTRQQAGIEGYGEGVPALEALRLVRDEAMLQNESGIIIGGGGLYRGYWENILYAFPADVIKFVCYDVITQGRKNISPLEGAVVGAFSTAVAQLLTTPLDVVRNRVMALSDKASDDATTTGKNEKGYLQSLTKLAKDEGLSGLFAGASPRVGKAVLSGAIQFATYEETKQAFMNFLEKR